MTQSIQEFGDSFIRSMAPVHKGGSYAIAKKINKTVKPRRKNKPATFCNAPGCDEKLTYRSMSMVCKDHMHGDYCQCKRCLKKG